MRWGFIETCADRRLQPNLNPKVFIWWRFEWMNWCWLPCGWGIKKRIFKAPKELNKIRHQKILPWNPLFSVALATDKIEHFSAFWNCSLSPVRFCSTLGLEIEHSQGLLTFWGSTLPFRQHLHHFGVQTFHVRWLLWNLRWFKICLWLV